MDQDMTFLGFNVLALLAGVAILASLWIASRVRTRLERTANPDDNLASQTATLLDASTTRRWMRFSSPDESDEQ